MVVGAYEHGGDSWIGKWNSMLPTIPVNSIGLMGAVFILTIDNSRNASIPGIGTPRF